MADFLALPTELKKGIISHVSICRCALCSLRLTKISEIARPTDLKSLALVSRHLHDLVTPYLYREVVIPYGNQTGLAVLHTLLQSTQHRFVRVVKLVQEGHGDEIERYLELMVVELLARLPNNSLTRLEWDGSAGVRSEVLGYLWQHHRGIQNFRLPSAMLHPTLSSDVSCWNDILSLGSIVDVNLTIRHPDDMRAVTKALEYLDLSHVKKFSAVFQMENPNQPDWQIRRNFFCGKLHLTLTVLRLVRHKLSINIRGNDLDGFGNWLEFSVLNRLEICYCTNMDVFFASIRTPVLKHFELRLRSEIGSDTPEYNQSVNTQFNLFLRRFRGLQTLLLQTRLQRLTLTREIMQQHAPTLRIYLNDLSGYSCLFVPEWFKALKQIAMYEVYSSIPGNDFSGPDYRVAIVSPD